MNSRLRKTGLALSPNLNRIMLRFSSRSLMYLASTKSESHCCSYMFMRNNFCCSFEKGVEARFRSFTLAASMAFATVINCSVDTDLSNHRLLKAWKDPDPDLRFDISTPSSKASTFHPSFPFPALLESEADNSSCMQLSLAKKTNLLNESSLIDLSIMKWKQECNHNHMKWRVIYQNESMRKYRRL